MINEIKIPTVEITVVRIYTLERAENIPSILKYLQNEAKIRGISVFRAISGFGETNVHNSSFLEVPFSLPIIIEFFDEPEKVAGTLEYLTTIIKKEHLIFFPARANA
ncbi:DUF190 domain-containing protein [Legionella cincinnatiensis]|uniref:Uncharacterized ACR, COG1993 n=1 Tax=Legionella cincinnatiensis TaxID=28085 RepID=A0A378IHC7_9GAMM|nr:DUF190 domain-containing protein [Legionella cincinnatiensis]KTC82741.1 hypothetical protein Lcin_2770 [Legionella cincinnatiensis]STX34172.1 Uncharacterized ACR, COG1993 [Legionella cincinnatiensis]